MNNISTKLIKRSTIYGMLAAFVLNGSLFANQRVENELTLVKMFYDSSPKPLYWFPTPKGNKFQELFKGSYRKKSAQRTEEWLTAIETSDQLGLTIPTEKIKQIRSVINSKTEISKSVIAQTDTLITDIVSQFIKDLQQGTTRFNYDIVSVNRDSVYVSQLLKPNFANSGSKVVAQLDCKDRDYKIYKTYLRDSLGKTDSIQRTTIIEAMNYRRFLSMNHTPEFILINIPTLQAKYYKNDHLALFMKVILGKKSKQTPTIASYILLRGANMTCFIPPHTESFRV